MDGPVWFIKSSINGPLGFDNSICLLFPNICHPRLEALRLAALGWILNKTGNETLTADRTVGWVFKLIYGNQVAAIYYRFIFVLCQYITKCDIVPAQMTARVLQLLRHEVHSPYSGLKYTFSFRVLPFFPSAAMALTRRSIGVRGMCHVSVKDSVRWSFCGFHLPK